MGVITRLAGELRHTPDMALQLSACLRHTAGTMLNTTVPRLMAASQRFSGSSDCASSSHSHAPMQAGQHQQRSNSESSTSSCRGIIAQRPMQHHAVQEAMRMHTHVPHMQVATAPFAEPGHAHQRAAAPCLFIQRPAWHHSSWNRIEGSSSMWQQRLPEAACWASGASGARGLKKSASQVCGVGVMPCVQRVHFC